MMGVPVNPDLKPVAAEAAAKLRAAPAALAV
jgi:hypothetical protein